MLDQDENNFAWGEGGLECADLNVTHDRVFHSECLNSFCKCLEGYLAFAQKQSELFQGYCCTLVQELTQHEIMNLRLFMLCVKIRKYETFSIRTNSAMRNGP